MKTLKDLQARLEQLNVDAKKALNVEPFDKEAETAFNAIADEIEETKAQIKRLQTLEGSEAFLEDLNVSRGRRSEPAPVGDGTIEVGRDRRADDPWAGFEGPHDFLKAVHGASRKGAAQVDQRLLDIPKIEGAPTNFHRETSSDDGYMVPPALRQGIIEAIDSLSEDIFNDVDVEPVESNSVEYLRDESTPWGATGVKAYWTGEGEQGTKSRLVTQESRVTLHKLMAFVLASDELLQDASRLQDRLTRKSAMAIVWEGSKAIFEGSGAGLPLGFMHTSYAGRVEVTKETSQTAATFNANNAAKMFSRLRNPGQGIWYINQDVLPQLVTMTLGDQPIFIPPAQGIQQAPGGFLLGRPVKFSEHCQTLGTKGDVVFANPRSGYYSPRKNGVKFAQSMHLYFDYDVEAFRWTFRMGGTPVLENVITPSKGATRSDFVVLNTRA